MSVDNKDNIHHIEGTRDDAVAEAHKLGLDVADVVANRVADDDLMAISEQCLTLKSLTGLRIAGIIMVMGINQAAYGIDWGVIGTSRLLSTANCRQHQLV